MRFRTESLGVQLPSHKALGPGLLESAYEECLAAEMDEQGLTYDRQRPVPVTYKRVRLDCGYRVDFVVEKKLVVDLKAIEVVPLVMYAQVLTYIRFLDKRLGLLINFHVERLGDGVRRIVNNLQE